MNNAGIDIDSGILLLNPKFPHNVGAAVRAAACWKASGVWWTGDRVDAQMRRLPREERFRDYKKLVTFGHLDVSHPITYLANLYGLRPVCVEVSENATRLTHFPHPRKALYVFGPEDGGVDKGARQSCHHFVTIPSEGCLNLAAAVNVVLYDKRIKAARGM